jgi:hypothetical protein
VSLEKLSSDAVQRINGPSFQPLRQAFFDISEILLSVAQEPVGVLTTIYVKYQLTSALTSGVFAVLWLKNSKQIVLGLALPEDFESPLLGSAPAGTKYKGITKYLTIKPGDALPEELPQWAAAAYKHASANA